MRVVCTKKMFGPKCTCFDVHILKVAKENARIEMEMFSQVEVIDLTADDSNPDDANVLMDNEEEEQEGANCN